MGFILTSVAEGIQNKLLSVAAEEASLAWGLTDDLKMLQNRIAMISALLSDAENKSANLGVAVKLWLKKLKRAVYATDAILDGFQYEVLRKKIEAQGQFMNKVNDFLSPSKNPLAFRRTLGHEIKAINEKLDRISKEASDLGLQTAYVNVSKHSESGSVHYGAWGGDLTQVVGRVHDVSEIVQKLLGSNNKERLSVISIIGMAGQGKTTLAHLLCENESVVRHFDKIIRVFVSDDFEETRILNDMVQSLTRTNLRLSNKYTLVEKLNEVLKDKKYLLLLDDVWNENPIKWNSFKGALIRIGASMASKIIVTARSKTVASSMQASLIYELKGLSFDDSWTMFKQRAFAEGGASETKNLVAIGKEIVKRCGGLPLAIDVLGSLMYSKKLEAEWFSVKNNNMWGSIQDVNDLAINVIKLSYDHLSPSSLKHCFAYLSMFPKDSKIQKDSSVQLWMALGMLPYPEDSHDELEDVGNKYFDTLLGKSLLQEPITDGDGNIEHCKMHDLVHDLAERESKGYCLALRDSSEAYDFPDDIVHLSLSSPTRENMAKVCSRNLRTLILEGSLLGDMLENFEFLHVLVLVDYHMKELPKSVGEMKHLRYLDIARTSIKELPSSLTKLYNLQTLKVGDLGEVPKMFGNLVNLRHLYGEGKLVGVGNLTALRTLGLFVVSRHEGCLIEELGGLINLKGNLVIEGLGDVVGTEEAQSARLFEKKLQSLTLKWPWDEQEAENYEYVLEGLRPHPDLKSLEIEYFKGVKLSTWMISESFSALQNLVKIKLQTCGRCEQVPTLGLLPHLKKLELKGLWNVRKIGEEFYCDSVIQNGEVVVFFPSLKELSIERMNMLEWVDVKEVYNSSDVSVIQFPNLEKLEITECNYLVEFPNILSDCVALKELYVKWCNEIDVIPDIRCLTSLRQLEIIDCPKLICLPRGLETITSLENLVIGCCPGVASVPGLECLTKLERLEMAYLSEEFDEFPTLPSSLQSLRLYGEPNLQQLAHQHQDLSNLTYLQLCECEGLEALPGWLGNLSSLQTMHIFNCKNLKNLPPDEAMSRLTRLQELIITKCPLLEEACARGSGTEWHKIQHIPSIIIDYQIIQDIR